MNEKIIEAGLKAWRDVWMKAPDPHNAMRAALAATHAAFPGDIVEIEVPARSSTSKDGMRYRGVLFPHRISQHTPLRNQ